MKTKKRKFTIIELLVVVAIIGVLMGMLLPAVSAVRQNARKTRAKAEINGIISAMKQYEQMYGYYPVNGGCDPKDSSSEYGNYRKLMEYLTNYPGPENSATASTFVANPRAQRFLDAPSNYGYNKGDRTDNATSEARAVENGDYADPWGSIYQIYVDTDFDGVVSVQGSDKNGAIFVYSLGPDKKHDTGNEGHADNKDNICSWK